MCNVLEEAFKELNKQNNKRKLKEYFDSNDILVPVPFENDSYSQSFIGIIFDKEYVAERGIEQLLREVSDKLNEAGVVCILDQFDYWAFDDDFIMDDVYSNYILCFTEEGYNDCKKMPRYCNSAEDIYDCIASSDSWFFLTSDAGFTVICDKNKISWDELLNTLLNTTADQLKTKLNSIAIPWAWEDWTYDDEEEDGTVLDRDTVIADMRSALNIK